MFLNTGFFTLFLIGEYGDICPRVYTASPVRKYEVIFEKHVRYKQEKQLIF